MTEILYLPVKHCMDLIVCQMKNLEAFESRDDRHRRIS